MFVSFKWVNILFLHWATVWVTQVLAVRCFPPRGCWENSETALTSRWVTCFSLCQRPEDRQNPAATHWVSPKNSQESWPVNPRSVCLFFWRSQLAVAAEELGSAYGLNIRVEQPASKPVTQSTGQSGCQQSHKVGKVFWVFSKSRVPFLSTDSLKKLRNCVREYLVL